MKHIITTILLLIAATVVTVVYFRSLNQPGKRPAEVMQYIPNDASLVIEFSNDEGFYEAFSGNKLFSSVVGPQKIAELNTLKKALLHNPSLNSFFSNQHIFLSIYPTENDQLDFLITLSPGSKFEGKVINKLAGMQSKNFMLIKNKTGAALSIKGVNRTFYITENESKIISGSFSQQLITKAVNYNYKDHKDNFLQLSDQQNQNALAVLYINNEALQPLFQQVFTSKNPELLRPLRLLFAKAALSLNYKTNALMFNGLTSVTPNVPVSYLNLFSSQQPVENDIKAIFPSTTAYSTTFGISNTLKFIKNLAWWHNKSGLTEAKKQLFNTIKQETGVGFERDFNQSVGNGFAVVTTRFQEKLAIIHLTENQQLLPSLINISTMQSESIGQFNYAKIPFYLLGDAFSIFNKPYFMLVNNYLVLANTPGELRSYYESYNNQKFLSKTTEFNEFDDLLSERSNVSFFINFKNLKPVLKRELKPAFYTTFTDNDPGFKNFYGASYQLSATDNNFYTNFCLKLNKAETITNN